MARSKVNRRHFDSDFLASIGSLKPTKPVLYWDESLIGFGAKVSPYLTTWFLSYRMPKTETSEEWPVSKIWSFARFDELSYDEARTLAVRYKKVRAAATWYEKRQQIATLKELESSWAGALAQYDDYNQDPDPEWVCYIAATKNYTKIGISQNVGQRITALNGSSLEEVKLVRAFKCDNAEMARVLEKAGHKAYARVRVHGEWFAVSPTDVERTLQELLLLQ